MTEVEQTGMLFINIACIWC